MASYLDCDPEALEDSKALLEAMGRAVKASRATLLDQTVYFFEPKGVTAVYLLSESHASIHTYPEKNACFVDLFTCGDKCSAADFDRELRNYLKPKRISARSFLRHEDIEPVCDFKASK